MWCGMKISVIFIGDKIIGTAFTNVVLLSAVVIERKATCHLKVYGSKDVYFSHPDF